MLGRQDLLESSGQVGNKLTGTRVVCTRGPRWLGMSASVTSRPPDSTAHSVSFLSQGSMGWEMVCDCGSLVPHKVTAVNRETWSRSSQC